MFKRLERKRKEGQSVEKDKSGKTVLVCREQYSNPLSRLENAIKKLFTKSK